jgi:hypothetical protein
MRLIQPQLKPFELGSQCLYEEVSYLQCTTYSCFCKCGAILLTVYHLLLLLQMWCNYTTGSTRMIWLGLKVALLQTPACFARKRVQTNAVQMGGTVSPAKHGPMWRPRTHPSSCIVCRFACIVRRAMEPNRNVPV